MEFPDLGSNCSFQSCNRLDFLPMKCNSCKGVYCSDHFSYIKHDCQASNIQDVQVPVCPLCGAPVPGKRGEAPDVAVSAHIDNQCNSDPARERRNRVFKNKCSFKGCKGKELVPLVCSDCALNFCLRHRHAADHVCEGKLAAKKRQAAAAAMAHIKRAEAQREAAISFSTIQGNMTEDEALAHALAQSMETSTRESAVTRALNRQRVGGEQNSRCNIS